MRVNVFAHGTTYYHFANPTAEFDENFAKMRDMGLNVVRVAEIWPGWEAIEPEPGRFVFDDLDAYVRKAHAAGLGVVMGIGINNPPFWVFEDIADVRCVDVSGKVATRRVQSANHDNPEFREVMRRFIEAHVAHYAAMPGIVAWQFGNEMRYGVETADNECTRQRFRQWLRQRFSDDLSALNCAWGVHYRRWEEIYPYESRQGAPTHGLSPLALASRQFQAWSLEELMAWGAELVKRHSPLPVFHNNMGMSGSCGSHWRLARSGDIVVQDVYPTTSANPQVYNRFLLDCAVSIARSQAKDLWIGETSVGQYGTIHRDRPPQPLIETLVAEMIGCGIKGLMYFRHKPPKYEQPHKFTGSQTVLRRDGSEMEYGKTPRRISELVKSLGEDWMTCRPVAPQVGVYYPEESLLFCKAAGYEAIQRESLYGVSGLWNRLGHPVHILPTDQLLAEDLSALKVIYLPVSYLIPESVGRRLKEYVKAGGTLVSECRPGYLDGQGWLYEAQPGAGLHEVFGAREDLFWQTGRVEGRFAVDGAEMEAVCPSLCQSFRLEGAEAIGWNKAGEVIATRRHFGAGQAVLLGVAPSLFFPAGGGKYDEKARSDDGPAPGAEDAARLVAALVRGAGLTLPFGWRQPEGAVSIRYLKSDAAAWAVACNYGGATTVALPAGFSVAAASQGAEAASGQVRMGPYAWFVARGPRAGK